MDQPQNNQQSRPSSATHRGPQRSSTLNRNYVKKPATPSHPLITSAAKRQAEDLKRRQILAAQMNQQRLASLRSQNTPQATKSTHLTQPDTPFMRHPLQKRIASQAPRPATMPSASERKNLAIKQALQSVSSISEDQNQPSLTTAIRQQTRQTKGKKILLAFACAGCCMFLLGYFIHLNLPDISMQVAAMHTGINASYPSYPPRNFQLANVFTEEKDKVVIEFAGPNQKSFSISETKSAWDSTALLNNFVKPNWDEDYDTIREQGITIYISESNAAWVNGGIFFHLEAEAGTLSKKQIKNLVTSF